MAVIGLVMIPAKTLVLILASVVMADALQIVKIHVLVGV